MSRHAILLIAALAAVTILGGCSAKTAPGGSGMSLMERYHSGMDLMGDEAGSGTDAARAHLMRGLNYQNMGRTELAFEQFSRAAALDPDLAEARFRRGQTLLVRGMSAQALADFEAVMEKMPDFAPAHAAAGQIYFDNALYPEAEKHLSKALALDPTLVDCHVRLGVIRNYQGDHQGALAAFNAALAMDPMNGGVHNNIGMTMSMMGDDEGAVGAFRTALRLGAPSARAYNNMGLALARLKRWREALEAFRCAGGEAAAYNNLGYLYFLDEDYARAVAAFQRAIELEPSYYTRASENLKRARLALAFAASEHPAAPAYATDIPTLDAGDANLQGAYALPDGPLALAGGAPGPALVPAAPEAVAPRQQPFAAQAIPAAPAQATVRPAPHGALSAPATPAAFSPAAPVRPAAVAAPETAPSAAAAAFAPGPQPDQPMYTLHQSSWHSRQRAEEVAARLAGAGHTPYVLHVDLPGKGEWYRVTVGMFGTVSEARERLAELKGSEGFDELRIVRRQRYEIPAS
ncbi:SPOR domain-containing protein [Desulfocurvus sp. DL9XJH121]